MQRAAATVAACVYAPPPPRVAPGPGTRAGALRCGDGGGGLREAKRRPLAGPEPELRAGGGGGPPAVRGSGKGAIIYG